MRYIAILLLFTTTLSAQTKWRQIERSLTKWNVPAAYDSIPGQAGYASKYISLVALLDSLGIDSLGGGSGNGNVIGTGLANRVAYWKSTDTITFDSALYWNATSNRLGFNTTNPQRTLDVRGRMNLSQGTDNIFIRGGNETLTGYSNVAIGDVALSSVTSGHSNYAVGDNALRNVTTGTRNYGLGVSAGRSITTGSNNLAIGVDALRTNTTTGNNTAVGYGALYTTTGSNNVALGYNAGINTDGSSNLIIGYSAGPSGTYSNRLYIDNSDTGTPLIGGNFTDNNVGINKDVTALGATLHVGGDVIIDTRTGTMATYAGFDSNGKLVSFTPAGGGTIDSTALTAGYGINVSESSNNWTVSIDTAEVATPYDLSLVDQSATNEIQKIDTFQIFDSNKLRISLLQDGEAAKVVTLPSVIDSTVVSAGFGLTASESPANTFTIAADSTKLATQHDISGFVDGTGTATRPAFWSDSNTLTSDSNLDWDNTNKILKVGPNTPTTAPDKLQVIGSAATNEYIALIENESNNTAGGISIYGANTTSTFTGLNVVAGTTGNVVLRNNNNLISTGSSIIEASISGSGNAYFRSMLTTQLNPWSWGLKQNESYTNRFVISESATLTAAGERLSIGTGGTVRIKSLDTDVTAPTTSGTTKMVITDGNGDLSYANIPPTSIDSTTVTAGYGLTATESPANTFTIAADSSKLATQYDLTLLDPSSTNEIQTIDTFQVYDTNKLRISLSNDGQAAKVVTLPSGGGGGGIDSTIVAGGWGIDVNESPANTFTVKADTSEVATQYDLTLKQDKLVSGTNIKTVNSNSLLGTGNVSVGTVTSVATSFPITGGTITGSGTIGLNYDTETMTIVSASIAAKNTTAIWNADKLQGTNVSSSAPSTNHVLTYNGSQWAGAAPPAGTTNLTLSGSSSPFTLNSDTGSDVTFAAGTGIALSRSSNQLTVSSTLTAPETWADFTTNIQSWGSTGTFGSGKNVGIGGQPSTDFDVIGDARLRGAIYNSSNSAGSSGQVLTSQGTGAWTWTTPASAATDLTFSGASSPYTLNSSSGTDVTFTAGSGIGLSATSGNITLTATDASATNELQTISTSGAAGNITLSNSGGTLNLNVNDADASATNELQTISTSGAAGNITLSNGGGTLNLNVNDADANATNEAQTLSSSGTAISLSAVSGSGGGTVTLNAGTDISLTSATNSITVNSKEAGFAELYRTSDLTGVSLSGNVKMDFTAAQHVLGKLSISAANDRITFNNNETRNLRITYSGSYKLNDSGEIKFMIYKNGSFLGYNSECIVENDYTQSTLFTRSTIFLAADNDYFELYYTKNSGSATTIDLKNVTFNIEVLH